METKWLNMSKSQKVAAVIAIYERGMTASQLSRSLGTTRSAILGLYHRNNVLVDRYPLDVKGGRHPSLVRAPRMAKPPRVPAPPELSPDVKSVEALLTPKPAPTSRFVPLVDLERSDCRYVVSWDSEALFCAAAAVPGYSYCSTHKALVYASPKQGD